MAMDEPTRIALAHSRLRIKGPQFSSQDALRQIHELQRKAKPSPSELQHIAELKQKVALGRQAADVVAKLMAVAIPELQELLSILMQHPQKLNFPDPYVQLGCHWICAGLLAKRPAGARFFLEFTNPWKPGETTSSFETFCQWHAQNNKVRSTNMQLVVAQEKLEQTQEQLKAAKERIHTLEHSQQCPRQNDSIDALKRELEDSHSALGLCQADLVTARGQCEMLSAHIQDVEGRALRTRDLEVELADLKQTYEHVSSDHTQVQKEYRAATAEQERREAAAEQQIADLQRQCQLSGDQIRLREDERNQALRHVTHLTGELERLLALLDNSSTELQRYRREGDERDQRLRQELQTLCAKDAESSRALNSAHNKLEAAETALQLVRAELDQTRRQLVDANMAAGAAQSHVAELTAERSECETTVCGLRAQLEKMTTSDHRPSLGEECMLADTRKNAHATSTTDDYSRRPLDVSVPSAANEQLAYPTLDLEEPIQPCTGPPEESQLVAAPRIRSPVSTRPTAPVATTTQTVDPEQAGATRGAKRARNSIEHTFVARPDSLIACPARGGFQGDEPFYIVYGENSGVPAGSKSILASAPGDITWHEFYCQFKLDELAFAQGAIAARQRIHLREGFTCGPCIIGGLPCVHLPSTNDGRNSRCLRCRHKNRNCKDDLPPKSRMDPAAYPFKDAALAQAVVDYHNTAVSNNEIPGQWMGDGVIKFEAVDHNKKVPQTNADLIAGMQKGKRKRK